eukprot:COSAG05_NODE_6915_length_882_cov_0.715198_1_plen_67_part_10
MSERILIIFPVLGFLGCRRLLTTAVKSMLGYSGTVLSSELYSKSAASMTSALFQASGAVKHLLNKSG